MTEKYSVQIVVLGEVRAYMIFSYDPLCENRPHLLFLPSSCEIHSPYVTRALQRIGGGNEICRLRFHGKPVFLKGKGYSLNCSEYTEQEHVSCYICDVYYSFYKKEVL